MATNSNKSIVINSVVSGLSFIIGAATIFFLYRLVLNERGPEELGIWSLILSFTNLSGAGTAVFAGGLIKFVAKYHAREANQKVVKIIDTNYTCFFVLVTSIIAVTYPVFIWILPNLVPFNYIELASSLVSITYLAFFINSLSTVYLFSLDGLQLYYISQVLRALGRLVFLIGSFVLVPKLGLIGLGYAYILYNVFLFVSAKTFVHIRVKGLSIFPYRFNRPLFKEMLNYGLKFQVISIAQMTSMPSIKFLLSQFGSLSMVAFFEMAYQLVSTLKGAVSSLTNVLTPVYAALTELNTGKMERIFLAILRTSSVFGIIIFPLLFLSLPLISELWTGEINSVFITMAIFLGLSNFISMLAEPQYVYNMGSGRLNPNMITMIILSILIVILGYFGGLYFEALGVIIAYTASYFVANIYLIQSTQMNWKNVLGSIINRNTFVLFIISAFSVPLFYTFLNASPIDPIWFSLIATLLYSCIVMIYLWWSNCINALLFSLKNA